MLPGGIGHFRTLRTLKSSVHASPTTPAQCHIDDVGSILPRILLVLLEDTMRATRGAGRKIIMASNTIIME